MDQIQELKDKLYRLQIRWDTNEQKYGENHPKSLELRADINEMRRIIKRLHENTTD